MFQKWPLCLFDEVKGSILRPSQNSQNRIRIYSITPKSNRINQQQQNTHTQCNILPPPVIMILTIKRANLETRQLLHWCISVQHIWSQKFPQSGSDHTRWSYGQTPVKNKSLTGHWLSQCPKCRFQSSTRDILRPSELCVISRPGKRTRTNSLMWQKSLKQTRHNWNVWTYWSSLHLCGLFLS